MKRLLAAASVAFIILFMLLGCFFHPWNDPGADGWYIKLNIDPTPGSKAIDVAEYTVKELVVEIRDPHEQLVRTIHWQAADGRESYLVPVEEQGQYEIQITHVGEKNSEAFEAMESAVFNIQAMVITVIDITPGFIGVIKIEPEAPEPPPVIAAIGDSTTMGTQDAGILDDFQRHNYPYLIAQQMGAQESFMQPYVSYPGIGVPPYERPLEISNNQIIITYWPDTNGDGKPDVDYDEMASRLSLPGLMWPAPYNNLAVNGAKLFDVRRTTSHLDSQDGGNYAFDIVLRNTTAAPVPNFGGMTMVQEAEILGPDIILLWIGNNDILGTVLVGCGTNKDNFYYTDPADFEEEYRNLLNDLLAITEKIVMANIPSYLPFGYALDGIYRDENGFLNIFHPETFEPIDFDPDPMQEKYIPLLLEESEAKHLLLSGGIAYLDLDDKDGLGPGIPDDAALQDPPYSISDPDIRKSLLDAMSGFGLNPSGIALGGEYTITQDEATDVLSIIEAFNAKISLLSNEFGIPLVDIVASWWGNDPAETSNPFGGYSGAYAIQDEENTTFSLDGVHINNLGHALSANAFIKVLNEEYQLGIPELDPEDYRGQYLGKAIQSKSIKAIRRVNEMYAPEKD